MNARERFIEMLSGRAGDAVAAACPGGMMSMAVIEVMDVCGAGWPEAHADAEKMAALALAMRRTTGFDTVALPFCMTVEAESFGAEVDMGTKSVQPRVRGFQYDADADFELASPDWSEGRAAVLLEALRLARSGAADAALVGNVVGPFSLLGMLVDPLKVMRWTRRAPERLSRYLEVLTNHLSEFAALQAEAGADVICIAEPTATGEILGGEKFAEFVLQRLSEIARAARGAGARVIVHICGDVHRIEDRLRLVDADAVSVDAMVDIVSLAGSGAPWLAMGNLSAFKLADGTPEEIAAQTQRLLERGVRIIAPACGIIPETPAANLKAMSEAARRWRTRNVNL